MMGSMFGFGVVMTVAGVVTLSKQAVEDKGDGRHVTFAGHNQLDHDEGKFSMQFIDFDLSIILCRCIEMWNAMEMI
jgi:hypothetical protein